ncbi:MAG: alpha-ribazole phosphatase [Crocinitomicaceae bacterium]|nr:alpha-ribazole phosphatase [Crocinitomicaceae bacterium]
MEIHLIRHTPIDFDKNRCYGQLDVPLSASFDQDLIKMEGLVEDKYDAVFSSPKDRCTRLAEELNRKEVLTDNRLLELNFGDWEGKLWDEINQNELGKWMKDFVHVSPNNGETLNQMYLRISDFIEELRKTNHKKVLIVTHGGVIRCFWAYFLEFPLKNLYRIPVKFHENFKFNLGQSREFDSLLSVSK